MKYRKSISGVRLKDLDHVVDISINTHCPAKWVLIDTQDGHVYGKTDFNSGWIMPTRSRLIDARDILTRRINDR